MVIRYRLAVEFRILAFQSVQRIAMQELSHVGIGFKGDFFDSEEIAPAIQHFGIFKD